MEDYSKVVTLDLSYKKLKKLPDLSKYINLKILDCRDNQIKHLKNLPSKLKVLYCSNNQITNLDNLPSTLTHLYCSGNQITTLPILPETLTHSKF